MVTLDLDDLIHWFNAIRELPDNQRYRALEGMWDTQLHSKWWIIEELNKCLNEILIPQNIYVFGGWIGILSSMLFQRSTFPINKIRSIDIDPWCESVADTVCKPYEIAEWRFKAITSDMADFQYQVDLVPHIVINTSTEHVSQEIYNQWFNQIPSNTVIVVQGNNYFACNEHIRCAKNLQEFNAMSNVSDPIFTGELKNPQYTRFMSIWSKK